MNQGICLVKEVDKGTEFLNPNNLGMVNFIHFCFADQASNDFLSTIDGVLIAGVDGYISFFVNVNLNTGLSDDLIDGFSTFADDNLNLVHINLDGVDFRSSWSQLRTRSWNRRFNQIQNFKAGFLSLSQSFCQDFRCNSFNLDIHLQGGNPFASTSYLKVHIAKMVFQTLNVRQNRVVAAI